jgi:N utilization substance protein B
MSTQDDAPTAPRKFNPWARHRARRLALQALYQWQVGQTELAQLLAEFSTNDGMKRVDPEYFTALVTGVVRGVERIDATLAPQLQERTIAQLDPIERAALRIGVFELMERLDVPAKVVIDEAVGLCQAFGSEHSHSYVNGVLDALARHWRTHELGAARRAPAADATDDDLADVVIPDEGEGEVAAADADAGARQTISLRPVGPAGEPARD